MSHKTCLRCDWSGDTTESACPNCGVRLYVADAGSAPAGSGIRTESRIGAGHAVLVERMLPPVAFVEARPDHPGLPRRSRRCSVRPVAVLIVAFGLGLAYSAGAGLGPGEELDEANASADTAIESPSRDDSSSGGPDVVFQNLVRRRATVDGTPFSMAVPTSWERWDFSITRSIVGPQGAEAIVLWSRVGGDRIPRPCGGMPGREIGGAVTHLAGRLAEAPGAELVGGPWDITLGGRAAAHVVMEIQEASRCQPGFFFRWPHGRCLGACWMEASIGSRIDVWIIDVAGAWIVFEAATSVRDPQVELEIERIVRSVRFDV
jgi:hypothetical protein